MYILPVHVHCPVHVHSPCSCTLPCSCTFPWSCTFPFSYCTVAYTTPSCITHNLTSPRHTTQRAIEGIGVDFWLEVKGNEYLNDIFLYFADGVCGDWGEWDQNFDAYRDTLVDIIMQVQPEYNGTWYSDLKGVRVWCLGCMLWWVLGVCIGCLGCVLGAWGVYGFRCFCILLGTFTYTHGMVASHLKAHDHVHAAPTARPHIRTQGFPFAKPPKKPCEGEVGFSDAWITQQYGVPATSLIVRWGQCV